MVDPSMIIDMRSRSLPSAVAKADVEETDPHDIGIKSDPPGGFGSCVAYRKERLTRKKIRHTREERFAVMVRPGMDGRSLARNWASGEDRREPADALAGARDFDNGIADVC